MKKLLLACAIWACSSSSVALAGTGPCGAEDIACIRRLLLEKAEALDSMGRELGLSQEHVVLLTQENTLLVDKGDLLQTSNTSLASALQASQVRWYESPELWGFVGFGAGILVTVLIVFAASHVH